MNRSGRIGISRIGYMTGGKAALWTDENMAGEFTSRAVSFIEAHKDGPFFLYFTTHDPHVPDIPHPRFAGKTKMPTQEKHTTWPRNSRRLWRRSKRI